MVLVLFHWEYNIPRLGLEYIPGLDNLLSQNVSAALLCSFNRYFASMQAFEKYTRVEHGYTSIKDVRNPESPGYKDKMESFFLGETLKYFYLLFSDTPHEFDLTHWVFNSEGHPLPIFDS